MNNITNVSEFSNVSNVWLILVECIGVGLLSALIMMVGTKSGRSVLRSWSEFYAAISYFLVRGGSYENCPYFKDPKERQAKIQIFSLCLVFSLWDEPHYRNGTFQDDMIKNLRNVAIPGTGIPLSLLSRSKILCYCFLFVGYPIVALISAINAAWFHSREPLTHNGSDGNQTKKAVRLEDAFRQQLLMPQDWFSFWRLNCRLATFHSCVTKSKDYELEDKHLFLETAKKKSVPVSPCLDLPGVILKHCNEEGGLGFARYFSPSGGGEWLIQPILKNGPVVSRLLPKDAPLSTFRVITASRHGIPKKSLNRGKKMVEALSVVFRAGLAGAATDHESILFDVDNVTGKLRRGTTNAHWYRLGLFKGMFATPWTSKHDITCHPDTNMCLEGEKIESIERVLGIAIDAHEKLCPEVPLVGWDVSFTESYGMLLLEGNFSCNFFRGQFDLNKYTEFVDDYFTSLAGDIGY